jgi:hypothetical protein
VPAHRSVVLRHAGVAISAKDMGPALDVVISFYEERFSRTGRIRMKFTGLF